MGWLRELLTGHPVRFRLYDALGRPKHVFRKLVHELELHAGLIISLVSGCLLLSGVCQSVG
jgi:hypothetical protein